MLERLAVSEAATHVDRPPVEGQWVVMALVR
jgi:hypothetical protein